VLYGYRGMHQDVDSFMTELVDSLATYTMPITSNDAGDTRSTTSGPRQFRHRKL
jgi:hypothetical protein